MNNTTPTLLFASITVLAALTLFSACNNSDCKCAFGPSTPVELHVTTESGAGLSEFEFTVQSPSDYEGDLVFSCPENSVVHAESGQEAYMEVECYEGGVRLLPLYAGESFFARIAYSTPESGPTVEYIDISGTSVQDGAERTVNGIVPLDASYAEYRVRGTGVVGLGSGCCKPRRNARLRAYEGTIVMSADESERQ